MSEAKNLLERGPSKEEEYFKLKEQELIAQLKRMAEQEEARKKLAEAAEASTDSALKTLEELGYTRDTVQILHLIPLAAIAWADGYITANEREKIIEAAKARGVTEGSPGFQELEKWLSQPIPEDFLKRTLRLIGDILETWPEAKRIARETEFLALCEGVATASRGFLGFGARISKEERDLITQITQEIHKDHKEAAQKLTSQP